MSINLAIILAAVVLGTLAARRATSPRLKFASLIVLGVILFAVPMIGSSYDMKVLTLIFIAAILAESWNIIGGFAGYAAFGNVAFFGIGAYLNAVVMTRLGGPFILGLLAGGVSATLLALAVGLPVLRLRGHYFAIATLGVGIATREVVANIDYLGGGSGMTLPIFRSIDLLGLRIGNLTYFYFVSLFILLLTVGVTWFISRRRLGYALIAIREDEDAAQVLGVDALRYKVQAYCLSAFFTGLAGAAYGYSATFIDPESMFDIGRNLEMIIMAMLGGVGTVLGPFIGAFLLRGIIEYLWSNLGQWHAVFLGIAIVLIVLFIPRGLLTLIGGRERFFLAVAYRRHPGAPDLTSLLQIENVTRLFGGVKALSDISFDVAAGEIVGLIGPNGAGKTTLINCITGVFPPTTGRILFHGNVISGLPPHKIGRLGISRTFQVVKPFRNLSVLENVAVGAMFGRAGAKRTTAQAFEFAALVLKRVHLDHRADLSADGLTIVDRKRLELAKALAMEPELLLLDEVMAGLRGAEVDEAIDLIREIHASGITILLIEHVMKVVLGVSQRIVVLSYGGKIAEGLPEEVVQKPEVIAAYLGSRYAKAREEAG